MKGLHSLRLVATGIQKREHVNYKYWLQGNHCKNPILKLIKLEPNLVKDFKQHVRREGIYCYVSVPP